MMGSDMQTEMMTKRDTANRRIRPRRRRCAAKFEKQAQAEPQSRTQGSFCMDGNFGLGCSRIISGPDRDNMMNSGSNSESVRTVMAASGFRKRSFTNLATS